MLWKEEKRHLLLSRNFFLPTKSPVCYHSAFPIQLSIIDVAANRLQDSQTAPQVRGKDQVLAKEQGKGCEALSFKMWASAHLHQPALGPVLRRPYFGGVPRLQESLWTTAVSSLLCFYQWTGHWYPSSWVLSSFLIWFYSNEIEMTAVELCSLPTSDSWSWEQILFWSQHFKKFEVLLGGPRIRRALYKLIDKAALLLLGRWRSTRILGSLAHRHT